MYGTCTAFARKLMDHEAHGHMMQKGRGGDIRGSGHRTPGSPGTITTYCQKCTEPQAFWPRAMRRIVFTVVCFTCIRCIRCIHHGVAGVSGCRVHRCHEGDRIMAGKILPLGPATFPDMVEDWENEVAVFKAAGEHPGLPEG